MPKEIIYSKYKEIQKNVLAIFFAIVVCVFYYKPALAQTEQVINLNTKNGLPSNLVYGMITDRNGYLWICTDKGVVRYNGYECKLFNLSNGLPTEDIWELLEDKKGRIWISSISDEIGYIYKNKYHKAYLKNVKESLYPKHIRLLGDGIIFESGNLKNFGIFYEKNDTINSIYASDIYLKNGTSINTIINDSAFVIINELGIPIGIFNDTIYTIEKNELKGRMECNPLSILDSNISIKYQDVISTIIGNNIVSYYPNNNNKEIYLTNINNGQFKTDTLKIPETEFIRYLYPEKKNISNNILYIITNRNILKCALNNSIKIIEKFDINDFVTTQDNGLMISTVHKNPISGYCIGTTTTGVWLKQTGGFKSIKKRDYSLENYKSVGNHFDTISFWWNKSLLSLAVISNKTFKTYKINNLKNIKFISHYSNDTFFVGSENPWIFIANSGKIVPLIMIDYGSSFLSAIVNKDNLMFTTAFGYYSIKITNNKFTRTTHDIDRYNGIIYDSIRKSVIVYNRTKIATFNSKVKSILNKEKLYAIGIKSLENLQLDQTNGNLFLKGYDNVVMYDPIADTGIVLFNNLRFKDEANVLLHGNKLIITWKYGVLFSVILGKMKVSEPLLYLNSYSNKYKTVYGSSIVGENLLLNTDNGLLEIDIPNTDDILANRKSILHDYHLIVNYDDSVRNVSENDTIVINQMSRKLVLDFIFSHRSGSLQYFCTFNQSSQFIELNANEINIPESFVPDNYYKLYFYVVDNSWKSNVIELNVYIKPYWWQTKIVKRFIWIGAIILAIAIIIISILITRRLVLRATEKKQLQMEMELKSIYAQINPHFIFNSLNSALLLVTKNRMDEAYNHISKFSRLLRSYLKSSRNKMISIEEEVENLQNYMELQQTRFKDKFLFEIIIGNNIDQTSVKIPSLLLQPFVENAINHGITPKGQKGFLRIEFNQKKEEKKITCTIDDDGIGRKKSEADKSSDDYKKESYGNMMIKDLISIFNRYEGMSIDIKYTDKEIPLSGTIVTITIKHPQYEQ